MQLSKFYNSSYYDNDFDDSFSLINAIRAHPNDILNNWNYYAKMYTSAGWSSCNSIKFHLEMHSSYYYLINSTFNNLQILCNVVVSECGVKISHFKIIATYNMSLFARVWANTLVCCKLLNFCVIKSHNCTLS